MTPTTLCAAAIALALAAGGDGSRTPLCAGKDATLRCLRANFEALSRADQDRFWEILHASAPVPKGCKADASTVEFLALAGVETVNSEFLEFFGTVVENLCVEAPACMREAAARLDRATVERLRKTLEQPITFADPGVVARAGCLPGATRGPGGK